MGNENGKASGDELVLSWLAGRRDQLAGGSIRHRIGTIYCFVHAVVRALISLVHPAKFRRARTQRRNGDASDKEDDVVLLDDVRLLHPCASLPDTRPLPAALPLLSTRTITGAPGHRTVERLGY